MPDMSNFLGAALLSGGGIDQDAFKSYLKAQRQQMIGQALMQQGLTPLETPESKGQQMARISPFAGLAKALQARMGSKILDKSYQAEAGMMFPQTQPSASGGSLGTQYPTQPAGQPVQPGQSAPDQGTAGASTDENPIPGSPGNRVPLTTLIRGVAMGLPGYAELYKEAAKFYAPTELEQQARAAGIKRGTQQWDDFVGVPVRKLQSAPQMDAAKQTATDPNASLEQRRQGVQTYNTLAAQIGAEPLPMPNPMVREQGPQKQPLLTDPLTNKSELLPGSAPPSYDFKETWDPATHRMVMTPVQTGGFGYGDMNWGAPPKGAAAPPQKLGKVNLGFNAAPSDGQAKAATFAASMRSALETMRPMEEKGVVLTPTQRSLIMDAATNEDPGVIHSLLSQEGLSKLGTDGQTYLAAMMPLIQAVSHDQAGARVTTSQLRMNLESMIPPASDNPEALKVINQNRDNFYNGLLVGSGPASEAPEFKGSIGMDRARNRANSIPTLTPEQARTAKPGTHYRTTDGRILVR